MRSSQPAASRASACSSRTRSRPRLPGFRSAKNRAVPNSSPCTVQISRSPKRAGSCATREPWVSSNCPTMKTAMCGACRSRNSKVAMASAKVSVGKSVKHITSAAMPARARLRTALAAPAGVIPLSIRRNTRGLADSTPRLHATAPPLRSP